MSALELLQRPYHLQPTAAEKIRHLNYVARTAMGIGCRLLQTSGFSALPAREQSAFREAVETFDAFTPENDPYEENDRGTITRDGVTIIWKIDYYDRACKYGSEAPQDPRQTTRVLTLMLEDEY